MRVKTAATAAGGLAAVFRSRLAPGVRAGAFGHAGSVQKVVDVLGAAIHAVPLDACVEVQLGVDVFLVVISCACHLAFGFVRTLIYGVASFPVKKSQITRRKKK